MTNILKKIVKLVSLIAACSLPAIAQPDIVENFSKLNSTWGASISPDGNTLAIGCVHEERRAVCISPLAGDLSPTLYPAPRNAEIIRFYWGSPDHVVMVTDMTETTDTTKGVDEVRFARAISFNARTGRTALLLKDYRQYNNTANVVSLLSDKDDKILMVLQSRRTQSAGAQRVNERLRSGFDYYVFEVDLDSGAARQKRGSSRSIFSALFNETGERMITTVFDDEGTDFEIIEGRNRTVYEDNNAAINPFDVMSFTADGEDILVWSDGESVSGYGRGVWRMSLEDASLSRIKVNDFEIGAHPPIEDQYTNRAVGFSYTGGATGISAQYFTDPDLDSIQSALAQALGDGSVRILSWTPDRDSYVIVNEKPGVPTDYYLFSKSTGQLSLIGSANEVAAALDLGEVIRIRYEASDGLEIRGYLTLPPGKTRKDGPFPVLLMPHGGPDAFDNASYDWWSHAYAAAGYAVLRPNFRGSSGFGADFREAGFGEFGGKMITDVVDGLTWMEAEGLAKPGGACIVGASYGGYSALMAPLLRANDIKCAISVNGVTDPFAHMGRFNGSNRVSSVLAYWEQYMGELFASRDQHAIITPTKRVAEYTTPVLLIHGDEDTRVSFEQYEGFVRAAGDVSWLTPFVMRGENHFLATQASREMVLEQSLAFLAEHHPVSP